jgi:hypothetical protein
MRPSQQLPKPPMPDAFRAGVAKPHQRTPEVLRARVRRKLRVRLGVSRARCSVPVVRGLLTGNAKISAGLIAQHAAPPAVAVVTPARFGARLETKLPYLLAS